MKDSVEIVLSAERIVRNWVPLAVGVVAAAAGIIVGSFSVWTSAAISVAAGVVSIRYPASSTVREIVKMRAGN